MRNEAQAPFRRIRRGLAADTGHAGDIAEQIEQRIFTVYGKRARIGCIVPSTNTVVESEFNNLKPDQVSIHAARIMADTVTAHALDDMNIHIARAAEELSTALVDVILYACTSGSFLNGMKGEQTIIDNIENASSRTAITTSGSVLKALRALNAKQIVMATPYTDAINEYEKSFLESSGFTVMNMKGLQKVVNTQIGCLGPEDAYDLARSVYTPEADALFISCTDLRTFEIIDKLESELDIPVISSNQAGFWNTLRTCGVNDAIDGLGRLFR